MTTRDEQYEPESTAADEGTSRRELAGTVSKLAMGTGLVAGYGALGAIAGRFLYPARPEERQWTYVTQVDAMEPGESLTYRSPSGETINITRKESTGDASDFVALSSTCPHLGCQVHWEAQNERYFCPCHNGSFDADGVGTGGPPGDAKQDLPQFEVAVEEGLLYLRVRVGSLADASVGEIIEAPSSQPGHDPCLAPPPKVRRT